MGLHDRGCLPQPPRVMQPGRGLPHTRRGRGSGGLLVVDREAHLDESWGWGGVSHGGGVGSAMTHVGGLGWGESCGWGGVSHGGGLG